MTAQAGGAALFSPMVDGTFAARAQLRREMRLRRRALSHAERKAASIRYARLLRRARLLRPGRRIAVYLAHNHEADLATAIELARRCRCHLYLPAIVDQRRRRMEFFPYLRGTKLRRNRFGIAEPDPRVAPAVRIRQLDLMLLPLAAVDARGWRIGSGAGFYDRRLHHLRAGRRWRKPKLIGVAYEFQRVPRVHAEPWDVPLDAVLTEQGMYWLGNGESP